MGPLPGCPSRPQPDPLGLPRPLHALPLDARGPRTGEDPGRRTVHLRGESHEQHGHAARASRRCRARSDATLWSPRRWTTSSWTRAGPFARCSSSTPSRSTDTRSIAAVPRSPSTSCEENWNLLIYPEGGRSPDGELHEFKGGAAYLAERSLKTVIPMYIHESGWLQGPEVRQGRQVRLGARSTSPSRHRDLR